MNETHNSLLATTGTTTLGYSQIINGGTGVFTNPNNTTITTATSNSSLILTNTNNMSKQVKVAVFTVKRNDKNEIISSAFNKEFWVEQKNGGSIVLAASKQLDKDFDPDTTIIREVQVINF